MADTLELLRENGFDVENALRRVMGKKEYYYKILKKFPDDKSYEKLRSGLAEGDVRKAFEGAHTLKGISGNAGITPVYAAVQPVVELLRAGSAAGIGPYMDTLEAAYARAVSIIGDI